MRRVSFPVWCRDSLMKTLPNVLWDAWFPVWGWRKELRHWEHVTELRRVYDASR